MTGQSIITYSLDTVLGAFPVESIMEIYRVVAFTPFEGAPPRVVGYASFRGDPLYGIDVQDVFNLTGHVYNADASIIVTRIGNAIGGILVDHIGDIRRVDESMEIRRDEFSWDIHDPSIRKAYSIGDMTHYELDFFKLFTEEEHRRLEEYSSTIEGTLTRLHT